MTGSTSGPPAAAAIAKAVRFDALSYLEANADELPNACAVWQEGVETTFAELREAVWRLIAELQRREVGPSPVVAVALPNVAGYVALEAAVPATGAALLPLPMGIGTRELRNVLARSGAQLLITDESPRGRRCGVARRTSMSTSDTDADHHRRHRS